MPEHENAVRSSICIYMAIGALVTVAIITVILLTAVILDECDGAIRLPSLCRCEPTIELYPSSGRAGTTIMVHGARWKPNTLVLFHVEQLGDGKPAYPMLYGPTTNGQGDFTFRLELDSTFAPESLGAVMVIARAEGCLEAKAVFEIVLPRQLITGHIGRPLALDANDSIDIDGSIVSCDWGFGDGQTGSGCDVEHVYDVPGTYTVTLTVTDDRGLKDTAMLEAMVLGLAAPNQPPMAIISADGGGSGHQ